MYFLWSELTSNLGMVDKLNMLIPFVILMKPTEFFAHGFMVVGLLWTFAAISYVGLHKQHRIARNVLGGQLIFQS